MFEIVNLTPLDARLQIALNKNCQELATLIIKGCFEILPDGSLRLVEQLPCIQVADQYFDNDGTKALELASDMAPIKYLTDIAIIGTVQAARPTPQLNLLIDINSQQIRRCLYGNRYWLKSGLQWAITSPDYFEQMAVGFMQSFGGSHYRDNELVDHCAANPVGQGYFSEKFPVNEGALLPNLERPEHLINHWQEQPTPAGLGFVASNWAPRTFWQGTYDENWRTERAPLLPLDFNERFFNCAQEDMQFPLLRGNERIKLHHFTPEAPLNFQLPSWNFKVNFIQQNSATELPAVLDTLVIDLDKRQVQIVWRTHLNCFNKSIYLDKVVIEGIYDGII